VTGPTNTRLDFAERWLRDGMQVLQPSLSILQVTVDMSNAVDRLDRLRAAGTSATSTHLLVKAAADSLAANPDLHQLIAGQTRHRPERIDIGLSVGGETFVAPVLIIEGADRKSIGDIAAETAKRAPEVRAHDREMLRAIRRWGWLVPFGFARRAVLRMLFSSPTFRRKGAGTFQVTTVPADWACSAKFATAGVLVAGLTRPRVVVLDGQPAVRPTMILTLCGDHGIWDGKAAGRFLSGVVSSLEADSSR